MRVLVRLFASYREAAGVGRMELELPPGATVKDAIFKILKDHPLIAEGRQVVIAKNHDYATTVAPIAVSGSALSVDDVLAAVRDSGFGGIVVFLGTVRDRSRGKRVTHLEYEAYAEMAETKMREIAQRLETKHAPLRLVMHHRVGDLAIGDIAVIVAAGAPHRDAAFIAARAAIDELKTVVPIWKKEHSDDGAVWIEDHA
jgi:molybdopterin synthase catalytic subunit